MLIPPLDGQIPTILNHLVILVDQEIAGDALLQKVQCSTLCSWDCGSLCESGVPTYASKAYLSYMSGQTPSSSYRWNKANDALPRLADGFSFCLGKDSGPGLFAPLD